MQEFRSNGKILLTGEYVVLDGAKALALPTRKGQTLEISEIDEELIFWKSIDNNDTVWFESSFKVENGKFTPQLSTEDSKDPEAKEIANRLQQILQLAFQNNPDKFKNHKGFSITTKLEFNRQWGLGTSSTLVNNLATWLEISPYKLLKDSFGGSGYDIAAAASNLPVTYQLTSKEPAVFTADFNPPFKDELFFVYLNKKQNSREAIAHYKNQPKDNIKSLTEKISGITEQIIGSNSLEEFKMLLEAHETLISQAVNLPKVKTALFHEYPGLIKSLGGWGGDFILASGKENEKQYFREKGYATIIDYPDLIL